MEFIINPDGTPAQGGGGGAAAAAGDLIKDSSTAAFAADVIEASAKVPVIVDFWAPWCGPCKQLTPALEKIVRQAGGLVRMVKINIDENQDLAQQLRIQSVPTIYAFKDGRPVDAFSGALPESQIRSFVDRLMGDAVSPLDAALEQAKAALDAGDADTAAAIYGQILEQEPDQAGAAAGMIRCATAVGDLERARAMAGALAKDVAVKPEVQAAISALDLAEQTEVPGDIAEYTERLDRDANDHQARFDLAMAHYAGGRNETAVDELIELVRRDRAWNDEAARKQLVKIFEALGHADPLTVSGRRQLSTILFS